MSKKQIKTPLIYALEPRLLFDGDLGADLASAIVYRDGNASEAPAVAPENQRDNLRLEAENARTAIVFIDGALEDPQTLVDGVPANAEVYLLDGQSDGFDQINDILENHDRVDEIHIFGHGIAGEARLGTASLSLENLTEHAGTLAVIQNALTDDGDILLYGCNIAEGEEGRAFVEELAEITAADITASDDLTGAGGDWELEVTTGPIETETIIVNEYLGRLSNGVYSTTSVTEAHSATDLESGAGHEGDGLGIQITQEQTGIQTDADLNFNLGSNLTNDAILQLNTYLVYRNTTSGNSGSARIVFDNGIAGINWVDWRSDDSGLLDAQFAKTGASYDDLQGRGLESGDKQNVSFSGRALNITGTGLTGDTNGDYMRVFVYSSPASITAVDDAQSFSESVKVEAEAYEAAANIDLTSNDTTTSSSKRVVGLGSASDNINENPSHLDIGSLGLSAIAGVYGELRVASDNTISYWITDDGALESALANSASVTETFYYRVANEFGSEDDGEITITINQANDRPVANPYTITRDYDSAGFTIGTASSDHPLVAGGITDADDSGPFVFSGIHADTSSAITLTADAASVVALTDFGTVTVNASDELVFTPDAALADLPQGQSLSRSFIYFVSDDGGAYNEGSDGVDRSDKITITINGTASIETPQFKDQNQQVAKLYFQKNNTTTSSGNPLSSQRFNVLNDTRFAHSSNPSAHGESNLLNGDLINDIWTISGAGNTLEFGGWTSADGTADPVNATASEKQGVTTSSPHFSQGSGQLEVGNSNYFNFDDTLGEGDTGTYTWYYRVNVVNNGSIISSDIGQLDIILEGINDVASTVRTLDPILYDKTNSGQGDRITTAVTASKNLDISITDPDAGDTTTVQRIRLYARLAGSYPEKNEALDALEGSEFFLNRGESTDDSDWEHSDAWGVLSDHFVITFNSDGTLDYVSKRDAYRSSDGDFTVYVASWTEHVGGVDSVQTNIDRTGSIQIRNIEYSANNVEFVDDAVAVSAVGSGTGSGSVALNDKFFSSLESFQRSTGSNNVRVAAGQTIVGEYITLTMNANGSGSYSYTLNQEAFNALGDGETASESFTYWGARNPNAGGEFGQATLTFNFTGLAVAFVAVNDTARVVAGQTITGVSGDLGNQSSLSVYESSGTMISNDTNDAGDLTVVGVWLGQETINATPTTIPSGGNVQVNGTYGVLTIYANGGYDYVANSGVTSEETEYFTYTVRNGDGEDDTAELAITIVPATDNEFVVEDLSHTMTDIGAQAGLTKTVTIANLLTHDANAIQSGNEAGASYAITGYAAGDSGSGFSNVGDTIRGTYGTLTINADGVPTYVFDRPYSLQDQETGYDVFTFEVTDGRGSPTTNTAQLTVQINGVNTTPSWSDDAAITITEDTGVTLTKYGDLAQQGSNNATGYNTALTGGWANYLEDEFGDVEGYQISRFDNVTVDRSSWDTTEGWTSWRSGSGQFLDTTIGSATNQNSILIGSVPFSANNTNDKITIDNTIQVGQSDVFNASGELTGNINIRGTFDVTVIGVQNTPILTAVSDDVTADEKKYFSFGEYFYSKGSYGPVWGPGAFESVTGDASATEDIFANDTNVPASMDNILRVEVSSDGSNWTEVTRDGNNNPSINNNSRIGTSDFYWRKNSNSSGGSYVEYAPSGFEALESGAPESGSFHYRIVELDGTTTTAVVSTQLTPVDDPPEVHRQGAVLDGSGTITVGASDQPIWNNNDGGGFAKPPSGVNNYYAMGNNGDDGDGVSIREVDMPGEHTGGLLDKSNSLLSADVEDNAVILSVTPRHQGGAAASELTGLGNNDATSVTLRGNHGELTVSQDGGYTYNADVKRSLNWIYSNSYENYDYVDSFNIQLGTPGVSGTGSVTTTLDIFFDGTDGAPVAEDDTAHVKEDLNINVSGNAAASTSGGDDDSAVDAPGEHSGNLLANDTDANPNPNLQINAAGAGSSLSTLNLAANTDNPYRQITGTYGTLSIYKDGSYNYVANLDAADNLAAGQTANDVFGYRVIDNNNDTDTASLTITVHGSANETYDREVTTPENQTYDFVHTIESNVITATNFWTATEVDSSYNPPIQIISLPHSGTLRIGTTDILADDLPKQVAASALGTLNYVPPVDTNGDDYTFFNYQILDVPNMGGVTVTMTIDITPDPNNAAPTITDPTAVVASIAEIADGATGETTADVTASGSFTIADGDNDAVTVTQTAAASTHEGNSVLGTLTIGPITNNTNDDGVGRIDWSYAIKDSHLDTMAVGDSFTETFTLTVDDGSGGTVTQDIVITVNGANDAPVAQADSAAVAEGQTINVADGQGDNFTNPVTSGTSTGDVLHTAGAAHVDTDVDGDTLRVSAIAPVGGAITTITSGGSAQVTGAHGVLTMYGHGGYDYTANRNVTSAGATETENFTYTVTDDNGGTTTATLQITIIDVPNDAPVAVDDVISVTVGTPATGNIMDPDVNTDGEAGEDSDAEDDALSVTAYETNRGGAGTLGQALSGVYGTLLISADGSYTYTVDETNADVIAWGPGDPVLTETFNYTIADTGNETANAVITVNVSGVNDPPTAEPIVETRTKAQAAFSLDLLTHANAADVDGDTLTAIHDGDASDDEPIVTFSRTGTTRVMVTAENGRYLMDGAEVDGQGLALNPGRTYIFDWSGATGHPMRLSQTADGTHGGGVEYTVGVSFNADAGTTTLVVSDATPSALYTYCETHADMGFDTPVEAYALPDSAYTLTGSTLNVNPQVFADLASDNEVEIAIAYKIADGDIAEAATYVIDNTATITITGLNTRPEIIDDKGTADNANDDVPNVADVTTPEDTSYVFTLDDFNYVDADNDPMASVLITQGPPLGQLTLNDVPISNATRLSRADIEAGLVKYTPPTDQNGDDYTAFTYAVNDGKVDSEVGAMTIHVTPVNDPPSSEDKLVVLEGTKPIVLAQSVFSFVDVDDLRLDHVTLRTLPANGTLFLIPDNEALPPSVTQANGPVSVDGLALDSGWAISDGGIDNVTGLDIPLARLQRLVYVPNEATSSLNYDSFTFTVNDGSTAEPQGLDSEATYTIQFGQLVAEDKVYSVQEDGLLNTRNSNAPMGLAGDDAGAISNLRFNFSARVAHGTLDGLGNGHFEFKPQANYFDTDSNAPKNTFEYTISANGMTSEPGVIAIHVAPANDSPVVVGKINNTQRDPDVAIRPISVRPEMLFGDIDRYDPDDSRFARDVRKVSPAGSRNGASYDAIPDFGALTYAIRGLPEGLSLNEEGLIVGQTSEKGRHLVTVTATDGGLLSAEHRFYIDIMKPMVEPFIEPEVPKQPDREILPPEEKTPALNPHDLAPVMKVSIDNARNRQIGNEVDRTPTGGRDALPMADDDANLGDDNWLHAKTSSQLDISGNIRVIDLKVKGREIAVQITDEASDRAERFKGELADGSPLPDWIKVDRNTGLTTADPPAGAKPFEMRVVAEDGGGNTRAIDLILDPTALNSQEANAAPVPVATTPNAANEAVTRRARLPTPEAAPSRVTANVLADGQVAIGEAFVEDATGSLKLIRMISETDGITVEITDDARADQTRYEVRQKDGSAAPDWVQVNARTGELTIDAPLNIEAVELKLVALDGGAQRTMDLELDLNKLLGQDAGGEESLEDAEGVPAEDLGSDETEVTPVSNFMPFDAQIDAALVESSYGRDIQQALSATKA